MDGRKRLLARSALCVLPGSALSMLFGLATEANAAPIPPPAVKAKAPAPPDKAVRDKAQASNRLERAEERSGSPAKPKPAPKPTVVPKHKPAPKPKVVKKPVPPSERKADKKPAPPSEKKVVKKPDPPSKSSATRRSDDRESDRREEQRSADRKRVEDGLRAAEKQHSERSDAASSRMPSKLRQAEDRSERAAKTDRQYRDKAVVDRVVPKDRETATPRSGSSSQPDGRQRAADRKRVEDGLRAAERQHGERSDAASSRMPSKLRQAEDRSERAAKTDRQYRDKALVDRVTPAPSLPPPQRSGSSRKPSSKSNATRNGSERTDSRRSADRREAERSADRKRVEDGLRAAEEQHGERSNAALERMPSKLRQAEDRSERAAKTDRQYRDKAVVNRVAPVNGGQATPVVGDRERVAQALRSRESAHGERSEVALSRMPSKLRYAESLSETGAKTDRQYRDKAVLDRVTPVPAVSEYRQRQDKLSADRQAIVDRYIERRDKGLHERADRERQHGERSEVALARMPSKLRYAESLSETGAKTDRQYRDKAARVADLQAMDPVGTYTVDSAGNVVGDVIDPVKLNAALGDGLIGMHADRKVAQIREIGENARSAADEAGARYNDARHAAMRSTTPANREAVRRARLERDAARVARDASAEGLRSGEKLARSLPWKVGIPGNVAVAVYDVVQNGKPIDDAAVGTAGGIAGSMATGALGGMAFGPVGAAAGGIIGGFVGSGLAEAAWERIRPGGGD